LHVHFNYLRNAVFELSYKVKLAQRQRAGAVLRFANPERNVELVNTSVFVKIDGSIAHDWGSQTILDVVVDRFDRRVVELYLVFGCSGVEEDRLQVVLRSE